MKNVLAKNDFLYCNWEGFPHMIRSSVGLDVDVDRDVLSEAVQEAAGRYPYFCIKVVRNGEDANIVHNDAPVPVLKGDGVITLGSDEANGHFMAVSCEGRRVIFDIYHNLTDAKGLVEWIKTVIYLYLTRVLDEEISSEGIRLPGMPLLDGEADDPYENMKDGEYKVPSREIKAERPFVMDERYTEDMGRMNYMIRSSVSDVMRISKEQDGSPVVLASYYFKEVLRTLYPDQKDNDILCGIPHSVRDICGGPNNYHSLTVELTMKYDEKINALPRDTQFTCTRGAIAVQSMPKVVKSKIVSRMKFSETLDELPTMAERHATYKKSVEMVIDNNETMAVSYPGNIKMGGIEPHLTFIRFHCSALVAPIMVEIFPINGWFYYSIVQNRTTDVYAKKLVELFNADGIEAEYLGSYGNELCGLSVP